MIEVKRSPIHGRGLFASQFILEGTILGELVGEITRHNGPHVLWINEHIGLHVTNDLRYINHDDTPNAVYFDDLTVVALRDIHPGEEITHDYEGDFEENDESEFIDEEVQVVLEPATV